MSKLSPFPESDYLLAIPDQPYDRGYTTSEDGYTAEQMLSYGAACRAVALEEAAVKCIELMKQYRFDKHTHEGLGDIRLTIGAQEEIAAAIRALKDA